MILLTFLCIWLILFTTKGEFVGENFGLSRQFSLQVSLQCTYIAFRVTCI